VTICVRPVYVYEDEIGGRWTAFEYVREKGTYRIIARGLRLWKL
jgi:hypothetical protein